MSSMVIVAQLVEPRDCDSGRRGFESHRSPQFGDLNTAVSCLLFSKILLAGLNLALSTRARNPVSFPLLMYYVIAQFKVNRPKAVQDKSPKSVGWECVCFQ